MKKVIVFLSILVGGGLVGWAGAKLFLGEREPDVEPLLSNNYEIWLLLALPVLYLFVAGIHELGHVLFGRVQNFQFYGLIIGPCAWKPDVDGKIRFSWNKNLSLAGGVAMMIPNGAEDLRRRFLWFAAGGPLASLLLVVLAYGLSLLILQPSFGYSLAMRVCLLSGAIFVITIIPMRAGGFASDGLRILTFARNGPTAAADLAGLRAIAHLRAGRPHAEFPVAEFAEVSANENIPAQQRVTMNYYRYLHALAVGNINEAAELYASVMDRLDVYPESAHGNFHLEQALFEAHYRHDLPAALAAFARYTDSPFTEALSIHLAEAAIAALQEDKVTLAPLLPAIEAALPASMDQGRTPLIKEWLKQWKDLVAIS